MLWIGKSDGDNRQGCLYSQLPGGLHRTVGARIRLTEQVGRNRRMREGMGSPVLLAASIDFAFSQMEDRMLVRCLDQSGGAHHLWLTRRLCRAFLQQFGALLAMTAQTTGLPDEQRQAMVLFEHLDALNDQAALARDQEASAQTAAAAPSDAVPGASDGAAVSASAPPPSVPAAEVPAADAPSVAAPRGAPGATTVLMNRIDVTPQEGRFDLRLFGGETCAVMLPLTRADAHRLLAVLLRTATQADWGLEADVGWVGDGNRLMQGQGSATVRRH